jgi:hypothetical protein
MPSREQLAATPMTMPERADPGALRPVRTVRGGNGFVF